MKYLYLWSCLLFKLTDVAASIEKPVEMYFAMSLEELSMTPITIASGSPKTTSQSASIASVITAEQIKSMGATELHEVLETVPGMHTGIQGQTGDYQYSVRGIRNATNSELLFLLDGTRINSPYLSSLLTGTEFSLENIQRIEVIRGPGSAMYGADAFAGVINIVTKKKQDLKGATLGARVGNWNTQSGWGQYGTQVAGWNLATSLQYQHTTGDDGRIIQADSQTTLDNVFKTHASLAPGAMNSSYESFNGHLNLQRKYMDMNFWAFSAGSGTRAGSADALDPNGHGQADQYLSDFRFSSEDWLPELELTSHISYLHGNFRAKFQEFPNQSILPIAVDGNINFKQPAGLVRFPDGANADLGRIIDVPAIELGAIYRGLDKQVLRFNSAYRYEQIATSVLKTNLGTGAINTGAFVPPPRVNIVNGNLADLTNTPYTYLPDTHRSVWSLAAQDEWQITAKWQLTAGIRYDHYSDFGNTVNPRAALIWDINQQFTSRWLYGRAFRAPSFSELNNINNPTLLGNKKLKPETIDTAEWALDYHPIHSLRLATNLYYYKIHDFIDLIPDQGTTTKTYRNSASQQGYGSEFEWRWQISEQWQFTGNYAWQNSHNESTQQKIPGTPEHHVYVAGIWQFMPQWQLQSQMNWIGNRATTLTDNRPLNDYQTFDFIIRGKKLFGHVNVSAALKNAFDTRYYELASLQLPQNIPMPGRSFYLEATLNF